jgi:hypothetical protein
MSEIKIGVTIDEANMILEGLGHLPFAKVYALVAKIQEQASLQLNSGDKTDAEVQDSPPRVEE